MTFDDLLKFMLKMRKIFSKPWKRREINIKLLDYIFRDALEFVCTIRLEHEKLQAELIIHSLSWILREEKAQKIHFSKSLIYLGDSFFFFFWRR